MPKIPGAPIGATAVRTLATVIEVLRFRTCGGLGQIASGLCVLECPDCEGKGILERMESDDGRKWLEVFPRLCERGGGTGKVAKPRAGTGDS